MMKKIFIVASLVLIPVLMKMVKKKEKDPQIAF